jgi:hypothetical protein
MLLGRLGRVAVVLVLVVVSLVAASVAGWADQRPSALVKSRYETGGNLITRDAGYSALEPGTKNSLWLFGDSSWIGTSTGFWLGTTAAVGPSVRGFVPSRLTEIPTPSAAINAPSNRHPQGFLPRFPSGLKQPDGTSCDHTNGPSTPTPASWPTGVAAEPAGGKMLITYVDVCETGTDVERFNVAQYDPRSNTVSGITHIFTDTSGLSSAREYQEYLGSPIFLGKPPHAFLYLFGSRCARKVLGVCTSGSVVVARVPADPAHWQNPHAYRWWDGSTWVPGHTHAVSIIHGAAPLALAYAGDFSAVHHPRFVIITQTSLTGTLTVWQATSLTGTWIGKTSMAHCTKGKGLCRAFIGHPELSTSSQAMMSFYNPGDKHIRAIAVPY